MTRGTHTGPLFSTECEDAESGQRMRKRGWECTIRVQQGLIVSRLQSRRDLQERTKDFGAEFPMNFAMLEKPACFEFLGPIEAKFRRRISHEPNRMLMRENNGFFSFAFDSAHVKYGVWTWPQTPYFTWAESNAKWGRTKDFAHLHSIPLMWSTASALGLSYRLTIIVLSRLRSELEENGRKNKPKIV